MSNQQQTFDPRTGVVENKGAPLWVKISILLLVLAFVGVLLARDRIWARYYVWKLRQAAGVKNSAGIQAAEAVLLNYPEQLMEWPLYDDPDPQVRLAFVRLAVQMHKPITGDLFFMLIYDSDSDVRRATIRATAQTQSKMWAFFPEELRKNQFSPADKQLMAETLGRMSDVMAKEKLKQIILASSWPAGAKPAIPASGPGPNAWGTDLSPELLAAVVFALGEAYRESNNPAAIAALNQLKNARGGETFTCWLPAEEEVRAILLSQAPTNPQLSPLVPLTTQSAPTRTLGSQIEKALQRIQSADASASQPFL